MQEFLDSLYFWEHAKNPLQMVLKFILCLGHLVIKTAHNILEN
jgi:hypothetical protein